MDVEMEEAGNVRKSSRKRKALFQLSQLDLEPTRLTQDFDLSRAVEATKAKKKRKLNNSEEKKANSAAEADLEEPKKAAKPKPRPSVLMTILSGTLWNGVI